MLEVIGFIVWVLITIGMTLLPFLLAAVSGLGGGLGKGEKILCVVLFLIAVWSWVNIFSKITINLGG